jgi:hypothetical protein
VSFEYGFRSCQYKLVRQSEEIVSELSLAFTLLLNVGFADRRNSTQTAAGHAVQPDLGVLKIERYAHTVHTPAVLCQLIQKCPK